jgi:hypothetical protein
VSEGEGAHLGWVMGDPARARRRVGGGEGFYIARNGRRADLLALGAGAELGGC